MAKLIKVLHFTTHDEECGIAKYQEQFLVGMRPLKTIKNTIFPYSPNRTKAMSKEQFAPVLKEFAKTMADYDILHIQHEFSFYSGDELDQIVSEAKRQAKKVLVTVHTSLDAGFPKYEFRDLQRVRSLLGKRRLSSRLIKTHVVPIRKADVVFVHNKVVEKSLVKRGVSKKKIHKVTMPVPVVSFDLKTTDITKHLNKKPSDVIYCTVGFLSENKGMKHAVRALQDLPKNYKLAIIGGAHPSGANNAFIEELEALIKEHKLSSRIYTTGYIKDDRKLNALIRECDICVYPYDKKYYAGVTSAALNNSLANFKPPIAYPTESIKEMNAVMPVVTLCRSFEHQALAEKILSIDVATQTEIVKKYAHKFSYDKEAAKFVETYQQILER